MHVVKRSYGRMNDDFLIGWDILWGPIWSGRRQALTFADASAASEAAGTAIACMTPVPWIVPDFGLSMVTVADA